MASLQLAILVVGLMALISAQAQPLPEINFSAPLIEDISEIIEDGWPEWPVWPEWSPSNWPAWPEWPPYKITAPPTYASSLQDILN